MRHKAPGRPSAAHFLMLLHILLKRSRQREPVSAPSGPPSLSQGAASSLPIPSLQVNTSLEAC